MTQEVIRLSNFSKTFGKTTAVRDISLVVERGQTCGLLGLNGAGKTTTLSSIIGIQRPTSGSVALFEEAPTRLSARNRARVGVVLDETGFYEHLSGRNNLRLVARYKRSPESLVDEALERLGLKDAARAPYGHYSLGMKQRVALGAALLGDPDVVILDEPTKGLDPNGIRLFRDVLVGQQEQGKTVLLSSHMLTEVERLCTQVAVIDEGELRAYGDMDEILGDWQEAARLGADDLRALADAAIAYPGVTDAQVENGAVVVELEDRDFASLNSFLHQRGIRLSFLEPVRANLEDVFRKILDRHSKDEDLSSQSSEAERS